MTKQEIYGNVIMDADETKMKCKMNEKQGLIGFDKEISIASLLGFNKQVYPYGK